METTAHEGHVAAGMSHKVQFDELIELLEAYQLQKRQAAVCKINTIPDVYNREKFCRENCSTDRELSRRIPAFTGQTGSISQKFKLKSMHF